MSNNARRTGPALEAHYQLLNWLMQTVERFPKSRRSFYSVTASRPPRSMCWNRLIEATYTRERSAHLARADLGLEKLRFFFFRLSDIGTCETKLAA